IKLLAGKSLIPVDKSVSLDPCDHCLAGKQHRASFSGKSTRKHDKLELVHSDVCGPVEMESLGGNRNFHVMVERE
ncbi:hypothetical protein LINGRAPRIM_LOCUS288, partial [Linum grandiflorum]